MQQSVGNITVPNKPKRVKSLNILFEETALRSPSQLLLPLPLPPTSDDSIRARLPQPFPSPSSNDPPGSLQPVAAATSADGYCSSAQRRYFSSQLFSASSQRRQPRPGQEWRLLLLAGPTTVACHWSSHSRALLFVPLDSVLSVLRCDFLLKTFFPFLILSVVLSFQDVGLIKLC